MSGPTHNKGVLILEGFFRNHFAQDKPLAMSASLCFEQSYSGVDGDSASSTEIYALLSSLAALPLRQDLAVTGSVNQHGEVQPIGGVNEKIEGFYRGLPRPGSDRPAGRPNSDPQCAGPDAPPRRGPGGQGRRLPRLRDQDDSGGD